MRLDATDLRYITPDEFRVLTATEMGSKNHEVVPSPLIAELSGIRGGQVNKLCGQLAKRNLIARVQNASYDGYRLTYGGLDYLALRTFAKRKPSSVAQVGKKVGVGKESDIYLVRDDEGEKRILKLHRLGRISFRAIKSKRDYLGKRSSASWMYMSRLSAQKEFAYMKVLYDNDFPVPTPIDQARHCIVMSLIDADNLRAVMSVPDPAELYGQLMELIMRFARAGLIHGDFNEFNIMIKRKSYEPIVLDFPQMVSTRHENAEFFFNRDVNCIRRFFLKRFRFEGLVWPVWQDVLDEEAEYEQIERAEKAKKAAAKRAAEKAERRAAGEEVSEDEAEAEAEASEVTDDVDAESEAESSSAPAKRLRLDLEVEASGFNRAMEKQLMDYMEQVGVIPDGDRSDNDEESEDEDSEEDSDEEEEEDEEAEKEAPAPLDPEAEAAAAAARLAAVRLHQALGNDGNPEDPLPTVSDDEDYYSSSSESSSSANSDGPAPSDYTQYVRQPKPRPLRMQVAKLGAVDERAELKNIVAGDLQRQRRGAAKHSGSRTKLGNAKGHKWKNSADHITGQKGNSGWD